MSDSWISWKPRIDEPSKPMPSANRSSLSSRAGMRKCCHVPGRSMKRRSTIFTPFSRAKATTSLAVIPLSFAWRGWSPGTEATSVPRATGAPACR